MDIVHRSRVLWQCHLYLIWLNDCSEFQFLMFGRCCCFANDSFGAISLLKFGWFNSLKILFECVVVIRKRTHVGIFWRIQVSFLIAVTTWLTFTCTPLTRCCDFSRLVREILTIDNRYHYSGYHLTWIHLYLEITGIIWMILTSSLNKVIKNNVIF